MNEEKFRLEYIELVKKFHHDIDKLEDDKSNFNNFTNNEEIDILGKQFSKELWNLKDKYKLTQEEAQEVVKDIDITKI